MGRQLAQGRTDAVLGQLHVVLRLRCTLLVAGVFALNVEQVEQGATRHAELLLVTIHQFFALDTLLAGNVGTGFGRGPFGVGHLQSYQQGTKQIDG